MTRRRGYSWQRRLAALRAMQQTRKQRRHLLRALTTSTPGATGVTTASGPVGSYTVTLWAWGAPS